MSKEDCDILVNILMVGDYGVGKTSIVHRFIHEEYPARKTGMDYKVKKMEIDKHRVRVHIWDTAGQERYSALSSKYYRGANAAILVYDLTNQPSFNNVQVWLDDMKKYCHTDIHKVLVANQCDRATERKVSYQEGRDLAKELQTPFFEISAKDNICVDEAIRAVIQCIINENPSPAFSQTHRLAAEEETGSLCTCCS